MRYYALNVQGTLGGEMIEKLRGINAALARRFPEGNQPFQIMTRLLEECGELAQQVNHFEASGVKHTKHGEPDRAKLAREVQDVLICALQIADYYDLHGELERLTDDRHAAWKREGYI